ncbi:hypothetical protein Barb6_00485 [Bacteroidales bacterium Barb6]|nr:hypothetical protein Barb6XT_02443 [Bacteroidales bacterium Barb6XT]OAV73004.1 hypothetical protein Barb6_00631 [Bacteroidales bacterium Barb6]OAV73171.1 hypothetical protein Barb6_00485 [Bacteroidales bacterium Barb6]
MQTKIIKAGTSLGLLKAGSKGEEIVIRKRPSVREGWEAKFAKYAMEGEDELMLPEVVDAEAASLI